jgi:hypothetical protein
MMEYLPTVTDRALGTGGGRFESIVSYLNTDGRSNAFVTFVTSWRYCDP